MSDELEVIEPKKEEWDEFVYRNEKGTIFQSYHMKEVYDRTRNYTPILIALKKDDKIVAGLLAGIRSEKKGLFSSMISRAIIEGGPLFRDKKAIIPLMKEFNKIAKKKSAFTQIFNENGMFDVIDELNKEGYVFEDTQNYIFDLTKTEDALWKSIHKNRRKGIKRAEKKGVIIEEMNDKSSLPKFYELMVKTYKRVRVPVCDYSLLEAGFDLLQPKGMVNFFLAKYNNKYISARAVLNYKGVVYDWLAGSTIDSFDIYSNELLVWHILKWSKSKFKVFDFQSAVKPGQNYGPGEFKRRFGGDLVSYGRFLKINSLIKYNFIKLGISIYKKIPM